MLQSEPENQHMIWIGGYAHARSGHRREAEEAIAKLREIAKTQTLSEDTTPRFSPDGRYIAYRSAESGLNEIYVQTFPASGGKWLISTNGGLNPAWAPNGKELFFVALDGKLMSVEIGTGSTFEPGKPKPVFDVAGAHLLVLVITFHSTANDFCSAAAQLRLPQRWRSYSTGPQIRGSERMVMKKFL